MTHADTIRLTPMQHADALIYSWLSYAMHAQPDPQAHLDAAFLFQKIRARARKAYEYERKNATAELNLRQRKARERAMADLHGLIALLAARSAAPENIRASLNADGTINLMCGERGIVLGRVHGA